MIRNPGVPQNPLVVTRVVDRLDLGPHLFVAVVDVILQVGSRKVLKPWAHNGLPAVFMFRFCLGQHVLGALEGVQNRVVGLRVRVLDAKIPVPVMGGVDHGTQVVQMSGHLAVILTHGLGVLAAADNGSEHVRGHHQALPGQSVVGIADELGDGLLLAAPLRVLRVKDHVLHGAVHRKADVIELNLGKSDLPRLLAHLHQVIPHLLAVGIHPGKPLVVPINAAVRNMEAPLRLLLRQVGVPKGHHPGDGVNIVILQLLN